MDAGECAETLDELRAANRALENEKNRYLTVFESVDLPLLLLDARGRVENMNSLAARMFRLPDTAGSSHYSGVAVGTSLEPLSAEVDAFLASGEDETRVQRTVETSGGPRRLAISFKRMAGVSEKSAGITVTLVDVTEHQRAEDRLSDPSLRDTVTGLLDRRGFHALCEDRLGSAHDGLVELLYFDLDDMKRINETYGHAVGDEALVAFGKLLERVFRGSDTVARMGGDEFAVLVISERQSDEDALAVRFGEALRALNESRELPFWICTSMGRAAWDLQGGACALDELVSEADARMYEMKRKRHEGW